MTISLFVTACLDVPHFDGCKRFWQSPSLAEKQKRKGLQLALEPLNGQGIAGYVPKPELWARPPKETAPRENYML
jgi:hypothetical protein